MWLTVRYARCTRTLLADRPPHHLSRVWVVCDTGHQRCTQSYVRRPYGVGLLVAGYDATTGAHLYRTCPSGNFYEYSAYAIGARSQAGRTYLEKKFESFPDGVWESLLYSCGWSLALTHPPPPLATLPQRLWTL